MLIKLTITTEVYVDLQTTAFKDWPQEAQQIARNLLGNPRIKRQFLEELPALRLSWIAAKVERLSTGMQLETLL